MRQRTAMGGAAAITLLLALTFAIRHAIGETLESPAFSTAVGVAGGFAVGGLLVVALGARRARS
jgi:hypothetical protein